MNLEWPSRVVGLKRKPSRAGIKPVSVFRATAGGLSDTSSLQSLAPGKATKGVVR
jgi:hypothetical protein